MHVKSVLSVCNGENSSSDHLSKKASGSNFLRGPEALVDMVAFVVVMSRSACGDVQGCYQYVPSSFLLTTCAHVLT